METASVTKPPSRQAASKAHVNHAQCTMFRVELCYFCPKKTWFFRATTPLEQHFCCAREFLLQLKTLYSSVVHIMKWRCTWCTRKLKQTKKKHCSNDHFVSLFCAWTLQVHFWVCSPNQTVRGSSRRKKGRNTEEKMCLLNYPKIVRSARLSAIVTQVFTTIIF